MRQGSPGRRSIRIRRPNIAEGLALAALILAAGGSAAAAGTYLITSPNQIKPSVLEAVARQGFERERSVSSALTTVPPGAVKVAVAVCGPGYFAVSGGYSIVGPHVQAEQLPTPQLAPAFVSADSPGTPRNWAVEINNAYGTQTVNFITHARCVP